jgi:tyrosinase
MTTQIGIRRSLSDLQKDYDKGNKSELESLMRAWKGIKELPPQDPNSFFCLGGFHGEPFRGEGATNSAWWGGYCQHGTVLFPSWHRAYLWRLEKALQSIPGCTDVMLPFWDECSDDSRLNGIPSALTSETFELDGATIANPLKSFVLPLALVDKVADDPVVYSKPAGYETVRYPLSGLLGTQKDATATEIHNAQYKDKTANVALLNGNITNWLNGLPFFNVGTDARLGEIHSKFIQCLNAPTYTLFSNSTSAKAWAKANPTAPNPVMPLESPHNFMHLAVGGFDYPGVADLSPIAGANGDMGENDTAGLDPIFFFHHCFIDYTFWIWQRRHDATRALTIDPADAGSKYSADGAPAAGADPKAPLTLTTPLIPFTRMDGAPMTTSDCINIETQLGYSYGPGSLDVHAAASTSMPLASMAQAPTGGTLRVRGINRAKVRGSFLISAFAMVDGKRQYLGTEAVLSRWHVEGCMNCMSHLEATASFRLPMSTQEALSSSSNIEVEVRTRGGLLGGRPQGLQSPNVLLSDAETVKQAYIVEVI